MQKFFSWAIFLAMGLLLFGAAAFADTPAGISAEGFLLMNNQLSTRNGTSIGMDGSIVNVYTVDYEDGDAPFATSTIGGGAGQFAPISVNTATNPSVKVRVSDSHSDISNMVTVNVTLPPFVSSVVAFTDRIVVNLSQNVDGMAAMNCTPNYRVNGLPITCGGFGNPFVDFNGQKITIRGLNLSGTATFAIPATNTIASIDGLNNSLTATTTASLAVQALALPAITGISPRSGAVGATVTITGTNFGTLGGGSIGDQNHRVFFSGGSSQQTGPSEPIEADYTGEGVSWSNTSIVVKVPAGAQGGPINIKSGDMMNDMGENTFFDIAGTYTAKVYYGNATSSALMDDGDAGNIRIAIGNENGDTVYSVGDGYMTFSTTTDTFSITGVSSMGYTWAYDVTGAHLNAGGKQVDTSATKNLFMPATSRIISGTMTLGASCGASGKNKKVVIFAMPDSVDSGSNEFKQVEPAFFTTGEDCVANYAIGVPMNGTYRVEAHIPSATSGGITVSTPFTDPESQSAVITDAAPTATKNFAFSAATHRIVGTVVKPASESLGTDERGKLWVFAYQPQGGKGTGAQVGDGGAFTLNVAEGMWKVGVSGDNMPFPVEVQVDVDDTYLMAVNPPKGPTIVIAPPADYIEGYVKDAAGNGLANSSVYAWCDGGPGNGNAKTDSQGYYKMYLNLCTNYHVGANSQSFGFLGEQSGIQVTSVLHPTVNFSVSSTNNYTISGAVTKGGNGLQNAFVFITQGERGQMLGSGGTDSSGAYSVRASGGANRWIHVGLPGKGEVYSSNLGTIGDNVTQNIVLVSSTITVRVSPKTDFSQAFIGIHSDQGGGFSDVDVSATGDLYREYQIDVPRPGSGSATYYVEGGVPGLGQLPQNSVIINSGGGFTDTSGTTTDGIIEYTLSGFYTVSGTVTGAGVDGAWVWAAGQNGGGGAQIATGGAYEIKLRPGIYDLGVGKPGFIGNKINITVADENLTSQDLVLAAAGSTISGIVYLPDGSTPVTNAWVWAKNNTGGWAGGSTNASGAYSLSVGSGSWEVQAAYDGYNSSAITVAAGASTANITLAAIAGFLANLKNAPITPSAGGIVQEAGIKVDFPKNALGTDSSAGVIEVKNTTNIPTTASTKVIGNAREITARNSSNQNITTLSGNITIDLTVTKAEIQAQGLTFAQVQGMKISYWDSTANSWVEIPTSVQLHPATALSIDELDSAIAVTLSGTVSHLSSFAPTVPAAGAPTTPTGLAATVYNQGRIDLSWTAVSGATGYDVYRNTSATGTFPLVGSEPTVASGSTVAYSDTGLAASTAYYYKISALNTLGESAASDAVIATTTAPSSASGNITSGLGSGGFDAEVPIRPTASVAANTYTSNQSVVLTSAGATIHYTVDGTAPTCSSTAYTGAIVISSTTTLKAIACKGTAASSVASFAYTLTCATVSNAATYNAYPTCGPATCYSGYTVSGSACVVSSSGSGSSSGGGGSATPSGASLTIGATGGSVNLAQAGTAPGVKFTAPAGALSGATTVAINKVYASSSTYVPPAATTGLFMVGGNVFQITAMAGSTAITNFSQPVTLTFTYTDAQIPAGVLEAGLKIYYYDTAAKAWVEVPSTINTATNTITATINHLTQFAIFGTKTGAVGAGAAMTQSAKLALIAQIRTQLLSLIAQLKAMIAQMIAEGKYVSPALMAFAPSATTTATVATNPAGKITQGWALGQTSEEIKIMQTILAKDPAIYPEGTINGNFGPATLAAIKKFQVKYGIAKEGDVGYGYVGPATRAKLNAM